MIFFLIKLFFFSSGYLPSCHRRTSSNSSPSPKRPPQSNIAQKSVGILVGEFYVCSFSCVYLTACIFAINFYYCLILYFIREAILALARKLCYSIKPMKLRADTGPKQAIVACCEMLFRNVGLTLVLTAG